jgi:photosystem II stability/assembly factor-like uncharacterized protein
MKAIFGILVLTVSTLTSTSVLNAQWIQQNSGTTASLTDVVMLDSVTAIAVGRNGSIFRTPNAGATWLDVSLPLSYGGYWNAISFFDSTNGVIVGDGGVVMTTPNGGKGWLSHYIPGRRKCLSAICIAPGSFYVGADSGWVYNTSDTGRTWNAEKISEWPIRSLFAYRGPTIIGVSKYALTPYSLCTQYVIPPPSWNEKILPDFQGLGSAAFSGEFCNGGGAGFIVGVQGDLRSAPAIIRKSMSDTAWRTVSTGILRNGTLFGVSAPSATVIYVCGTQGMIFKSTNGGDTWAAATVPTTRNLNAIYFFDEKRGFAVGDSGLILHTSNGGVTSVGDREGHLPMVFALEQNYPNPFNPSTTIVFHLPERSFVSLKIFDMLGREVASLVSEEWPAGNYPVRWEAATLPSGVYFYRLSARTLDESSRRPSGQASAFVETKKLVLLR